MLSNAFVTVEIKDLYSQNAIAIKNATNGMTNSFRKFETQFNKTSEKMDAVSKKFGNVSRATGKFTQKFNELEKLKAVNLDKLVRGELTTETRKVHKLKEEYDQLGKSKPINLDKLIQGNLDKEIRDVERLKQKAHELFNRIESRQRGGLDTLTTDSLKRRVKELTATDKKQIYGSTEPLKKTEPQRQQGGNTIGAIVGTLAGGGILRSAIINAKEFDTALYGIKKQLGENENLNDYVNVINAYSLATGQSRVETAGFVGELKKTLRAGEGLEVITQKIDAVRFATKQLDVDTETATRSMARITEAFGMNANQLKGYFSVMNDIEDVYETVSGGEVLEVLGRVSPAILKNTKLLDSQKAVLLATYAKANTALDATTVGNNLGKVLQPLISVAEKSGKTLFDTLGDVANQYTKLTTTTEKTNFIENITGTKDMQAVQVFEGLLVERNKVNDKSVAGVLAMKKAMAEGRATTKEYTDAYMKLNRAEKAFVDSNQSATESLGKFNKQMGLLGGQHEATLGRISESWKQFSGTFGNAVLFPALNLLADGLEKLTPFITGFIQDYPIFTAILAGTAAVMGVMALVRAVGFLNFALLGTLKNMRLIALNPVFLAVSAGALIYDDIKKQGGLKKMAGRASENIQNFFTEKDDKDKMSGSTQKTSNTNQLNNLIGNTTNVFQNKPLMSVPTPLTQPLLQQPKGAIDVNVIVQGQAQVQTDVKKQSNMLLNLYPATTTRTI
jgi:hypothetical protein